MSSKNLTRRDFLRHAAVGAAGIAAFPTLAAAQQNLGPYAPFRAGLQSYSLRGYDLDTALAKTKELGIHYWESFQAHVPLTSDAAKIAEIKAKFMAAGVRLAGHGVNAFTGDKAKNRVIFEQAKAMGLRVLSADPTPDSFNSLDELVDEFKIRIAIHNHGPGARYDKPESVYKAIEGHNKLIGACVDCGHYLRSSVDPVKVIEHLGDRVYGVHLKDVKDAKTFTILGKGDLDVVGVLKALKANNYRGLVALEYEENPQNPMPDIEACLAYLRECVKKV